MAKLTPLTVLRRGLKALKNEFKPQPAKHPVQSKKPQEKKQSQAPQVNRQRIAEASKNEPAKKEQAPALLSARPIPATLLVLYLDENDHYLTDPQVLHGYRGENVELDLKSFQTFYLSELYGYTSRFIDRYGVVKLRYQKRTAAAIWVMAKDIDEQFLLAKPEFIHGSLHAPYSLSAPSFPNYRLVQAHGPVTGSYSTQQQFVTYLYRKKLWQEVDETPQLLLVTDFTACYSEPHGTKLKLTLAKNTRWQVFKTVKTTDDSLWYCLGGNTWTKQGETTQLFMEKQGTIAEDHHTGTLLGITLHEVPATVSFIPGRTVNVYRTPCGKKAGEISDGTQVTVTARKDIDQMHWYQIDQTEWILGEYLHF